MRFLWLVAVPLAFGQTPPTVAYTKGLWPRQDVCTVRLDGAREKCLTRDGRSHHPSWSPDGKRILFVRDVRVEGGQRPEELWVMDADGGNERRLRGMGTVIYDAAWSPDARRIVVSTPAGAVLLGADGTGELRVWKTNVFGPSWAPDSGRIAYALERPRGEWTVHTANADGSGDRRLGGGWAPAWSPDGRWIAFGRMDRGPGREQVYLMPAAGGEGRAVTSGEAWSCGQPNWTGGGDAIVASCRSAARPCGMGVFSTGQPMPECIRRVFVIPIAGGVAGRPRMLLDQDGFMASVCPR